MLHHTNMNLVQNKPTQNPLCGKTCLIILINSYSDVKSKMKAAFCIKQVKEVILIAKYIFNISISNQTQLSNSYKLNQLEKNNLPHGLPKRFQKYFLRNTQQKHLTADIYFQTMTNKITMRQFFYYHKSRKLKQKKLKDKRSFHSKMSHVIAFP